MQKIQLSNMNELLSLMADHVRKCLAERDMIARTIVCKRFGVDVNDIKTLKEVIASKKLSISIPTKMKC